jgi:outer membrane receptor for ferric coprogen and ferric-rhodotorulic acid
MNRGSRDQRQGSLQKPRELATGRRRLRQAISLALGLTAAVAAVAQTVLFNVPEQDAATGIQQFAQQAQLQIIAPADKLKGVKTHAVVGSRNTRSALQELLQGTGLTVASDDGHTVSLRFAPPAAEKPVPTPSSDASAESTGLDEVIVRGVAVQYRPKDQSSATGIAMPLVDTPQSISVLTSNMLNVAGAQSIYNATDLVPGVIHDGTGFGFERILMRGVYNNNERINGMELSASQLTVDGFAVDRVEVVRGPATALYGITGSFGGEINSELKRPTHDLQLQMGYQHGSFNTDRYMLDVSGPVPGTGGVLSARFAAKFDDYGNPIDVAPADGIRNHKEIYLASLALNIGTGTTATVWWYHDNRNIDPYDGGSLFQLPNKQLALPPKSIDPEAFYFSNPSQSLEHTEQDVVVAEVLHDFANDWRFTAEALFDKFEQHINYFYPFGPFGAYGRPQDEEAIYTYDMDRHNENVTTDASLRGDFQLLGHKQSFFTAVEGTESIHPNQFGLLNSTATGLVSAYQGGQGIYADGSPMVPVDTSGFGYRSVQLTDTRNLRASVQLLLNPIDRVKILTGLLLDNGRQTDTITVNHGLPVIPANVRNTRYTKLVKRVGLVYDLLQPQGVLDALNSYVNYSEGFQPQVLVDKSGTPVSYPQTMRQYEGGLKGEFLNHSVGSTLAIYSYSISNVPSNDTLLASFGQFGNTVANGHQKATGVEAELVGELLPGWNVSANYAYTATKLEDPQYTFTTPVANVPKHKGTIATSYEFLFGPLKGLRVGVLGVVSGDFAYTQGLARVKTLGQLVDGQYKRLDLNTSYKGFGHGLELYANLRNAFNDRIIFSKQGNPSYGVVFDDVRAFTVGLRYHFE